MNRPLLKKVFLSLTFLLAAFPILPYGVRSVSIITWFLLGVLSYIVSKCSNNTEGTNNKLKLLLLILPYLFLIISTLYSTNLTLALNELIKMSLLLVFPITLYISPYKLTKKEIKTIEFIFCLSVFVFILYQIIYSLINLDYLLGNPTKDELKYNGLLNHYAISKDIIQTIKLRRFRNFTDNLVDTHPTYQVMWILFALFFMVKEAGRQLRLKSLPFLAIPIIIMLCWSLLISSRMPLIAGVTSGIVVVFIYVKSIKKKTLLSIVLLLLFSLSYVLVDSIKLRVNEVIKIGMIKPNKESEVDSFNSTNVRNGIYYCSFKIIKNNLIKGVGIGDAQETLTDCLINDVQAKIYLWRHFNTHSQYLFFILTSGLFGLSAFLISLLIPYREALIRRDVNYIFFLTLILMIFLTENVLSRNDGILFFTFFNSLYFFNINNSYDNNKC
jgi:O-antigen ligase